MHACMHGTGKHAGHRHASATGILQLAYYHGGMFTRVHTYVVPWYDVPEY